MDVLKINDDDDDDEHSHISKIKTFDLFSIIYQCKHTYFGYFLSAQIKFRVFIKNHAVVWLDIPSLILLCAVMYIVLCCRDFNLLTILYVFQCEYRTMIF